MHNHWAEEFVRYAERRGVPCERLRHSKGWLETVLISSCRCFIKSMSYNEGSRPYFQGVDPAKAAEKGDAIVLCGGRNGMLADIFVVPWRKFFSTLANSKAINTYHDREYLQYKFRIRYREGEWTAFFQGGSKPTLDLTGMRFDPKDAIDHLQSMDCRSDGG